MLVSEESRGFSGLEYSDFVSKGQSAKSSNPMVKSRGGGKALLSIKKQYSAPSPLRAQLQHAVTARREFYFMNFKINTTVKALFREQISTIASTCPVLQEKWIRTDLWYNTRPPTHPSTHLHTSLSRYPSISTPIHLHTHQSINPTHLYMIPPLANLPTHPHIYSPTYLFSTHLLTRPPHTHTPWFFLKDTSVSLKILITQPTKPGFPYFTPTHPTACVPLPERISPTHAASSRRGLFSAESRGRHTGPVQLCLRSQSLCLPLPLLCPSSLPHS